MQKTNIDVKAILNKQVANHGVLYTKFHQHHWYVQGASFYTLHEKFEELFNSIAANSDEIAERLIAIGGAPYSTLAEYLEHASIEEKPYTKKTSANDMVASVVHDYRIIRDEISEGIELTGEAGDDSTQDMLIAYKTEIEKNIWMLQAFLDQSPLEGE
ncbi:DNA starvation/stationary phase protection protein [Carnobacterium divergens]|uniref:Dps family protein n=1 Tax=Carnobacterium divergens TaxID=2748 RepID=UPI001071E6F6|nr:DNA starvation/stationary phase protection protein [Carnobacterium divergens]TFJ47010.1 DNA starvation/stationary phase protection protein [Carnobacterium divergens]TFJ53974.1 DNA starvation/stationary phase protection protein [Carnobacterium divergens]